MRLHSPCFMGSGLNGIRVWDPAYEELCYVGAMKKMTLRAASSKTFLCSGLTIRPNVPQPTYDRIKG